MAKEAQRFEVGDEVVVMDTQGDPYRLDTVVRSMKLHAILASRPTTKWKHHNGRPVGGGPWDMTRIVRATPKLREEIARRNTIGKIRSHVDAREHFESLPLETLREIARLLRGGEVRS